MKTQAQLIAEIEPIVDSSSLADVLFALARMCNEKAEHLESNWQDAITARVWDRAARKIDRLAGDSTIETLS